MMEGYEVVPDALSAKTKQLLIDILFHVTCTLSFFPFCTIHDPISLALKSGNSCHASWHEPRERMFRTTSRHFRLALAVSSYRLWCTTKPRETNEKKWKA